MELHPQSLLPSLSSSTSSNTNNNNNNNNGRNNNNNNNNIPTKPKQQIPITRSESNPYPTTFVQADTTSFKQVVQMLTGSSESTKPTTKQINPIPPIKSQIKSKPSKLYERRSTNLKNLRLSPNLSPQNGELLSPSSFLDFPSLALSPVTPLIPDPFNRSGSGSPIPVVDKQAEEKAIAGKGYFLHPSPVSTPRDSEPRLLTLFPLTSPRVGPGSNSSS
ncbi:VQ motif-containing protein 4-like [Amaranthus tricolor]|uniref:VQ motif-containing protein 4-like n=1 Tax=Amaranthus tricolor TaxID=29722 RepID=UPI0025834B82|nr:VQ motif-containing protein 4-like [Amaranthus tricolor]